MKPKDGTQLSSGDRVLERSAGGGPRGTHRHCPSLRPVCRWPGRGGGRVRGMETQRRPGSTGAAGPAFAAPGTHGCLQGPGGSWGSGRRWVLPRRAGVKGSDSAQARGAGTERTPRPRRATSRSPPPPPRTRLTLGLDTPPPWRGRCQAPDSPRGLG